MSTIVISGDPADLNLLELRANPPCLSKAPSCPQQTSSFTSVRTETKNNLESDLVNPSPKNPNSQNNHKP